MNKKLLGLVFFLSGYLSQAQVNFNAYDKISDSNFVAFISLFDEKELPISTDQIVDEQDNILLMAKESLSKQVINQYLTDDQELIPGPLYYQQQDDGLPDVPIQGNFYPLYKLPTNGDYVLLVFMQIDEKAECMGRIFTLSYSLLGEFLYFSNYTYEEGDVNTNSKIDENLKSHHKYILYKNDDEFVAPPKGEVFMAEEAYEIEQINQDGTSSMLSFEKTSGQFEYSFDECRFRKIN